MQGKDALISLQSTQLHQSNLERAGTHAATHAEDDHHRDAKDEVDYASLEPVHTALSRPWWALNKKRFEQVPPQPHQQAMHDHADVDEGLLHGRLQNRG